METEGKADYHNETSLLALPQAGCPRRHVLMPASEAVALDKGALVAAQGADASHGFSLWAIAGTGMA